MLLINRLLRHFKQKFCHNWQDGILSKMETESLLLAYDNLGRL